MKPKWSKRHKQIDTKKRLFIETDFFQTCNQNFSISGLFPDPGVDVLREDGRGRVEDGGQRGHQGCQHDGQHQTSKADRHELVDQQDEGLVAAPVSDE